MIFIFESLPRSSLRSPCHVFRISPARRGAERPVVSRVAVIKWLYRQARQGRCAVAWCDMCEVACSPSRRPCRRPASARPAPCPVESPRRAVPSGPRPDRRSPVARPSIAAHGGTNPVTPRATHETTTTEHHKHATKYSCTNQPHRTTKRKPVKHRRRSALTRVSVRRTPHSRHSTRFSRLTCSSLPAL